MDRTADEGRGSANVEAAEAAKAARERDFLLERLVTPDSSWVGASSSALVAAVLTGSDFPRRWPMDDGDLGRCEETYRRAPAHLQELMLPLLERFREHVAVGGLRCRACDTSGHRHTYRSLCDDCLAVAAKPPLAERNAKPVNNDLPGGS